MEIIPQCFSLLLVGSLMVIAAYAGSDGAVPRNASFGIRTRWSMSSDAAWVETHRVFRPYSWICLGESVVFVIALIAVYVASGSVSTASVLMMCGFGMILLTTFAGLRAAKKAVTK